VFRTAVSHLKGYANPFALVLGRNGRGAWRVVEERSETRP
jgi:hypothetical protein